MIKFVPVNPPQTRSFDSPTQIQNSFAARLKIAQSDFVEAFLQRNDTVFGRRFAARAVHVNNGFAADLQCCAVVRFNLKFVNCSFGRVNKTVESRAESDF